VISVALIEDNRLVREGIAALLNQVTDVRVVAAASSGDTSVLRQFNPQVVLLDLGLRNGNSLRVAEKVLTEFPQSKVIVMDVLPVREDIAEFVNAGVSGFIMKDSTLEDLVYTIRTVATGGQILPRMVASTIFSRIATDAVVAGRARTAEFVRMTPREREVIDLIAEGLSNEEISGQLHIATYTVRSHVRNVMEKLMLHTRLQIAAYVHKQRS
jgi:DNA-binding NarL/FixJ family response regulator